MLGYGSGGDDCFNRIHNLQENTYLKNNSFHYCDSQPPGELPTTSSSWYSYAGIVSHIA